MACTRAFLTTMQCPEAEVLPGLGEYDVAIHRRQQINISSRFVAQHRCTSLEVELQAVKCHSRTKPLQSKLHPSDSHHDRDSAMTLPVMVRSIFGSHALSDILIEVVVVDRLGHTTSSSARSRLRSLLDYRIRRTNHMDWSPHGTKGFIRYIKFCARAKHDASDMLPHLAISALSPGHKVVQEMNSIMRRYQNQYSQDPVASSQRRHPISKCTLIDALGLGFLSLVVVTLGSRPAIETGCWRILRIWQRRFEAFIVPDYPFSIAPWQELCVAPSFQRCAALGARAGHAQSLGGFC